MERRGRYAREFKIEAVRLLQTGAKPVSELAMELGVKRTLLYRWKEQLEAKGEAAFSGSGRPRLCQLSEVDRLKREIKKITIERDILKKAAAYFTRGIR